MQIWPRTAHGCALSAAILLILGNTGGMSSAADHPSLVDPRTTPCETCHEDLLEVRVRHPPAVDNCLTCHVFTANEERTAVEPIERGSELCLACHYRQVKAAAGEVATPHAPVTEDCAACHDPHGTDADAMLVAEPDRLCFECHDADDTDAAHPIPVRRADCRSCHDGHGSETVHMLRGVSQHTPFQEGSCEACHRKPRGTRVRLLREGGQLCEACHPAVIQSANTAGQHTAFRQGRCVECHDPHLADHPHLLKNEGGALCFSCHREIAEQAAGPGAHPALEGGCDSCHDAHSSDRRALLLDDEDVLCRGCHDPLDTDLQRRHLSADMTKARCGSCHDPHGSETRPLIAVGSIHVPFRDGCSGCHEGSASLLKGGGGNALCEGCHDDVAKTIETAAVPHPAMEAVDCVECHSPHASRQPSLLRASGGGTCVSCHEEQLGSEGQHLHRAIPWIGCQSCHLPHGGSENHLLRATGNELCNGCHLQGRVRVDRDGVVRVAGGFILRGERARELGVIDLDPSGQLNHPIPGHPVAGTIQSGGRSPVTKSLVGQEMTCRLCHEPHAAPSPQLFNWQATTQSELCVACHPN